MCVSSVMLHIAYSDILTFSVSLGSHTHSFMCLRVSIQERHAVFRNEQRRVTLTPLAGSKVIVNGNAVSETTELQHLVGPNTHTNCDPVTCVSQYQHTD